MRILVWCFLPPDPSALYWQWLKGGNEAIGHQVVAVDGYALTELFGPHRMQDILLAYARAYRIQAAIVVAQPFVPVDFLNVLRAMGIAVVSYRYDDGMTTSPGMGPLPPGLRDHLRYADAACDLAVTNCRNALSVFADDGGQPLVYLPVPYGCQTVDCTEKPFRPVISYTGRPKFRDPDAPSFRVILVRAMLAAGLPLELHHAEWATVPGCEAATRPTADEAAYFEVFRTSGVNLALGSDSRSDAFRMIKLVHLEIAAAGGMQLTQRCAELDDYFVGGTDIAYADDIDEFMAQTRYYLAHPDVARQLGRNSRKTLARLAGWEHWWGAVAGHLADKGIRLDLVAPPCSPDPAETPILAAAAIAMAHLHEKAGKPALAARYFQEVLLYDPTDVGAHNGLVRLADPQVAAPVPTPIGWPGIGADGTPLMLAAAVAALDSTLQAGNVTELEATVKLLCSQDYSLSDPLARWLTARGHPEMATRISHQ